jgi:exosortase/archaeosortase family protein
MDMKHEQLNSDISRRSCTRQVAAFLVLLCLCLAVFRDEVLSIFRGALALSEWAHALVVPVAIVAIISLRRAEFKRAMTNGSFWGIALIVFGLAMHGGTRWPFSFNYGQEIALVPTVAGVVLVSFGWRIFFKSIPLFVLVGLAVPFGGRMYATMVIRPETYTIKWVAAILERLGGTDIFVRGVDMIFLRNGRSGIVALAETNRGARLMLAFASLGVFVLFCRPRSWPRIFFVGLLGIAAILFCNFVRFLLWASMEVFTGAGPLDRMPRYISGAASLVLVYFAFAFLCWIRPLRLNLFVEVEDEGDSR